MESPISFPIPSDQGTPSSITSEVPVVSDTLPVILSIQSLNSCTPEDESYNIHWNPISKPFEEDIPVTPPSVSIPMSSSNMHETNPILGEETLMASSEIPVSPETSPFHVTPLGVMLPLCYNSLADIMDSISPLMSSMWSHTITPTSEPFMP